MSYCTRCGSELPVNARVCAVCFAPRPAPAVARPSPPPVPAAPPAPPAASPAQWPPPLEQPPPPPVPDRIIPVTDGGAIASFVLGAGGVLLSWGSLLFIGVSIAAIVIGSRAEARIAADPRLKGEGMARAGKWLGVAGTAIALLVTLAIVAAVVNR